MDSKALASILRYYEIRNGELLVGEFPISQLAEKYPTPFYAYDLNVAQAKYLRLRNSLPKEIDIHYAIKANPHPEVIRFFNRLGLGFDVASSGELRTALEVGVDPKVCGFAGPGKSQQELEYAIQVGIGSLNVESERELEITNDIAGRLGVNANVSLRINPSFQLKRAGMRIGGGPQAFGIDQEQVPSILKMIRKLRQLHFVGFHIFAGSQNLTAGAIIEFFDLSFALLKELLEDCPHTPEMINLGGGFGIPYFPSDEELDMEELGAGTEKLLAAYREFFPTTRFYVESGRYLIGESGIYITRVRYKKVSRGETYLVVDGGLHHHLAATGNFGQVIRRNYPIAPLEMMDSPATETVNIVGPLCTPLDVLGSGVKLPEIGEGDLIGIFGSGAYGFSASPRGFLSHPEPTQIVLGSE
jgi:diaminopimelate decarboxylase